MLTVMSFGNDQTDGAFESWDELLVGSELNPLSLPSRVSASIEPEVVSEISDGLTLRQFHLKSSRISFTTIPMRNWQVSSNEPAYSLHMKHRYQPELHMGLKIFDARSPFTKLDDTKITQLLLGFSKMQRYSSMEVLNPMNTLKRSGYFGYLLGTPTYYLDFNHQGSESLERTIQYFLIVEGYLVIFEYSGPADLVKSLLQDFEMFMHNMSLLES
jgi:hypothetical protein